MSTDDGRQMVANQVRQLRELAVSRDFEIFREYTDEETGASANRASFLALLRDARLRINPRHYLAEILPGLASKSIRQLPALTPKALAQGGLL